jgi:hypothetical protein
LVGWWQGPTSLGQSTHDVGQLKLNRLLLNRKAPTSPQTALLSHFSRHSLQSQGVLDSVHVDLLQDPVCELGQLLLGLECIQAQLFVEVSCITCTKHSGIQHADNHVKPGRHFISELNGTTTSSQVCSIHSVGSMYFMLCYSYLQGHISHGSAHATMSSLEPTYKVIEFNSSTTFARNKVEDVANDQVHLIF